MPATTPFDKMARFRMARIAEAQRIHHRDGARAHGEHVAHDAADAGGSALIGLDEARVVVAFHLEDGGIAIADVDHACVLAGALQHPGGLGRQLLQMDAGGFVGAVLGPHHAEDAQFHETGFAVQQLLDPAVFLIGQAVFADEFGRDLGHLGPKYSFFGFELPPLPGEVRSLILLTPNLSAIEQKEYSP